MPLTLRTNKDEFPGALTEITEPFTCTKYPTFQGLAKALQEQTEVTSSATIVGGRIMTDLTPTELTNDVCVVI